MQDNYRYGRMAYPTRSELKEEGLRADAEEAHKDESVDLMRRELVLRGISSSLVCDLDDFETETLLRSLRGES